MTQNKIEIALFQPDIAGNVGTIMRMCACLDVKLHIIEPCGFVFDMQKIRKSALDYIDHVQLSRHKNFDSFYAQQVQKQQKRLVLLTTKAQENCYQFKFQKSDILLLGRESAGVPDEVFAQSHEHIKIDMQNNMRSLNVAICAAMITGEALRQTIS
jgi:tRNA (cytidine/uridine-2'-O-)-methyltransferase